MNAFVFMCGLSTAFSAILYRAASKIDIKGMDI